jgi:hypothetical protein
MRAQMQVANRTEPGSLSRHRGHAAWGGRVNRYLMTARRALYWL